MPRKPLIRTTMYPYHIVSRSNNGDWFNLEISKVWELCLESLTEANKTHPIDLMAFVLMSNHYHLMIKTPQENIDHFMYEFNKRLSLKLRAQSGRINRMFGGRYKWCLIKNPRYLFNCYRYIYQNPVRAMITASCESYPYSTLYYLHFNKKFPLTIVDPFGPKDHWGLRLLNEQVETRENEAIRSALYHSELTTIRDRVTKRPI